ncbi:MAG TPA: adenosine kinase [Candidatus Kapabacteria bacterium]|nr:adenosine kinase [Candidatus Kapabacteria bacterium]
MSDIKDIELSGFGNGLIDILLNVEDSDLIKLNLTKGTMSLIDDDKSKEILNYYRDYKLKYMSGGSAANSIIAYAQLGGKAAYNTFLGDDKLGGFYADEFNVLGIQLNAGRTNSMQTGTCIVLITPDSERTMLTNLAATSLFNTENIKEDLIKKSEWIYIEGYHFSQQLSSDAVFKATELSKKHNTKISVTFSDTFITDVFRDNLMKVAKNADLIFCNNVEAMNFAKTDSLDKAINFLDSLVPNYAITLGAEGSIIKWNGKIYNIKPYKANLVDTTGAGDMYAGTFLYSMIKGDNIEKAGSLASLASSKIVSQIGPRAQFDIKSIYNEL